MTLYLKYRPQTLDELDLESVRDSLKNIVAAKSIPHAFLFSGPKGTGKTSAARILAKIINCLAEPNPALQDSGIPCNNCDSCLSITNGNNIDIIELDAASNRGIDDVRSLKSSVYLAPARAKKKIYIIDEVHMLTLEAANAFLKTLEEPPSHVIFILATTNPEKLPATVISRLARVDFTKASDADIARQLIRVAKGEKIKIAEEAIKKISKLADGSFRDAVKILENLSFKTKNIKAEDINENSGDIKIFFEILISRDTKKALEFIENLIKNGVNIKNFSQEILSVIHQSLLAKNGLGKDELSDFSGQELIKLNELVGKAIKENSPVAQLPIEIAILKFISKEPENNSHVILSEQSESKDLLKNEIKKKSRDSSTTVGMTAKLLNDDTWQKFLQNIRVKNVSIEALLRAAKPLNYDGKILKLGVYYKFHKEHLESPETTKILEDLAKTTLATDSIKIVFELIEKEVKEIPKEKPEVGLNTKVDKDIIDAAKEIFG